MSAIRNLLRQRRAEIQSSMELAMREAAEHAAKPYRAELADIDTALYALEMAAPQGSPNATEPAVTVSFLEERKPVNRSPRQKTRAIGLTLKDMILRILAERKQAEALEILEAINRRWDLGLARTSLSPQLSRLKAEGRIELTGKTWVLIGEKETPVARTTGVGLEGAAGSPGGPSKLNPTGSTPVVSTTSPLFPDGFRKEVP